MSGDIGLKHEPIIFYSEEMTMAKMIMLRHKGVQYHLYRKVMKKINKSEEN